MERTALIGLDGLSLRDLHVFGGEWYPLEIETIAHTCPSWNAIFTGKEHPDIYDFWKTPDNYIPNGQSLAEQSDTRWKYSELSGDYLWEELSEDVEVVSAPVVLPTYSTLRPEPDNEVGWPATYDEIEHSIEYLTDRTLERDRVITVFPVPDKCNHLLDSESDYYPVDRDYQLEQLKQSVYVIKEEFDNWLFLSDHGQPSPQEEVLGGDLWVASHDPTGVITSNTVEVAEHTNKTIYPKLKELFQ